MHHDTNTAAMVRVLCTELLPTYPAKDFVLVILHTLTQLAATTLVDIPVQINLLIKYLRNDPRWEVKSRSLQHLHQLAQPGAHLWSPDAIDHIIDINFEINNRHILMLTLKVLLELVKSPTMCHNNMAPDSKLRELCMKNCYSSECSIAVQSVQILTEILCYCYRENLDVNKDEEVVSALENLILLLTFGCEKRSYELKIALKCVVQLCEAKSDYCGSFVELLGTTLKNIGNGYTIVICETLGAIGSLQSDTLLPLIDTILDLLRSLSEIPNCTKQQRLIKTMLCTLIFQTLSGYAWNEHTESTIKLVTEKNNHWANYCIARAAIRYGHHSVATNIFEELNEQVSSEHFHFWLVCLREMTQAEAQLYSEDSSGLARRLENAIIYYNKASSALKAASTPSHTLQFQAEYLRIRAEFLQCLAQLLYSCNILCIVPPPAIAGSIVQSTRDEFQRHGYITNQLRKCTKELKSCAELYWKLYQTAFDADSATLENIQILQQMCTLVEECVESVCVSGANAKNEPIDVVSKNVKLESRQLIKACENSFKISSLILAESAGNTITHKQVELLKKLIEVLVNAALPIPRYFFQILQSTSVKLAITPQPRVMGEFISVQAGSQLAVKVEGVIQHGRKPGLFRKVKEIVIVVTSQFQNNAKAKDAEKNLEVVSVLTQTVMPHKDFFTAQFLLAFPRGGQFVLLIEASVNDENGNTWKTGPKSTLTVKVPEEAKSVPIPIPMPMGISLPGVQSNSNIIPMKEDNFFTRPYQKKFN